MSVLLDLVVVEALEDELPAVGTVASSSVSGSIVLLEPAAEELEESGETEPPQALVSIPAIEARITVGKPPDIADCEL
jgi:hypothetical protein